MLFSQSCAFTNVDQDSRATCSVGKASPPLFHKSCLSASPLFCFVVVVVLKFAVFCNSVLGGDSGRPDGAEHSLHPCVHRERSVH